MVQPFYIQVALISKDAHLVYNYNRVLNASNKFLLVNHFEEVSDAIMKSDLLSNVNTLIFDVQTIRGDELVKLKSVFTTKKILAIDSGAEGLLKALSVGVDGYLSKRDDYIGLLDFVWKVAKGEKALDQGSLKYLFDIFKKELNSDLTTREMQVLEELSLSKSYKQIADELAISKATVKTHLEHIYDKLNAKDKFEAIEKARTKKLI